MDGTLVTLLLVLGGLVLLDVLALRYGVDSRRLSDRPSTTSTDDRPDWW